jgi:O-antigen ligase
MQRENNSSGLIQPIGVRTFAGMLTEFGPRIIFLEISFLVFLCGFFFMPQIKWQNNVFYTLVLIPYLIMFRRKSLSILSKSKIFLLVVLFEGYSTATLLWGEGGACSDYIHSIVKSLSVLVFYALTIELSVVDKRFRGKVFFVLCWVSLVGAISALYLTHYSFVYPPARLMNIGAFRNPIQASSVYGMILIIIYYHFLSKGCRWHNVIYIPLFIALMATLLLIQSRGPLLALIIAFFVGSLVARDFKMLILLVCIAAVVWILVSSGEQFLFNLIITRGTSYRLEIFQCVFTMIKEKILFGHGMLMEFRCNMSDGTLISRTHNIFLAAWLYGGIVGLSLLIAFIIKSVWISMHYSFVKNNCIYISWLIFSLICMSTGNHNVISNPHPIYLFFWMPLGLISAFEITRRNQCNKGEELRINQVDDSNKLQKKNK